VANRAFADTTRIVRYKLNFAWWVASGGSSTVRISSKSVLELWDRNLPFPSDLAIGLNKIVISQQIKEVIANGHKKLNRLMIAQTP